MTTWTKKAQEIAARVYDEFLSQVVEDRVLPQKRKDDLLSDKRQREIEAGKKIDLRPPYLLTISGKGGWHPSPEKRERYARCTNITLLDHLLSVVRGALLFSALEALAGDPEDDPKELESILRAVAAIAFMHDVDKDLGLERNTQLDPEAVWKKWQEYGLDRFAADWNLQPEEIVALIERVEVTQAHRTLATPPRPLPSFMDYIALADKLDGLWCCGGVEAVLKRLQKTPALRHNLLRHWQPVELYDPHHPFLLDEFLRFLSAASERLTGLVPLLEIHHDGQLLALIPKSQAEEILERALNRLIGSLRKRLFQWRLNLSARNIAEILEGQPDHEAFQSHFESGIDEKILLRLFAVQRQRIEALTPQMDKLLGPLGLEPRWPKATGSTLSPWAKLSELSETAQAHLRRSAQVAALLKHKDVPFQAWEKELTETVGEPPDWIASINDRVSRQSLLALFAVAQAHERPDLQEKIWGEGGLLAKWLDEIRPRLESKGEHYLQAIREWFETRLSGKPIDLTETGKRCLFTDLPVDPERFLPIGTSDALYGVKVSAFSGRDGRLENIEIDRGETFLSPMSYVEHRLRKVAEGAPSKDGGVPVLLSSPSTTGLFAALILQSEQSYRNLSTYDLARQEPKKGTVYTGFEIYRYRYRLARYEAFPVKLVDQLDLVERILKASLRLGRPFHLFRGLPRAEKAFFFFDALPERLAALIGGRALRIEQIPPALERIALARQILNTPGLGLEVFNLYAYPETRIFGIALTWCRLREEKNPPLETLRQLETEFQQLKGDPAMSQEQAPLIELGRLAARIQKRPGAQASHNEELMCFNLALEMAIAAWQSQIRDRQSLIYAVADELEINLTRKGLAAARQHREGLSLREGCLQLAEHFVDQVWFGKLNGRPPSQKQRRVFAAVYRMAFLTSFQNRKEEIEA